MGGIAAEGDELENGHRATTPLGDNLLLDYARGEADSFAVIAAAGGGRVARDESLGLRFADTGSASPFANTVHLLRPVGDHEIPALADALHTFFAAAPGGPFLIFSPWPIGDLSDHGFHHVGHPPLMLRPATHPVRSLDSNLRIVAVENADQLADYEQALIEAYPAPELQPWQRAAYLRPEVLETRWRFFVGYDNRRCVATAAAWLCDTVTIVEQVSVRDESRGKGYGAAITAAATHAAPGQVAMLVASDLGRSVYAQLGYIPLLRYTLHVGMRG